MKQCGSCNRLYPDNLFNCTDDGTPLRPVMELLPDTIIRGKYKIVNQLGAGGMATVYRAVHIAFNEERAIKIVNERHSGDTSLAQRFRTEAIITRKLRHPNAVFIEDLDVTDDGRPFIVMELVKGSTLRDVIHKEAPFAAVRSLRIARQAASALAAAHTLGITHRDVRPENIVLVPGNDGETVKVLDFGIAKVRAELIESEPTNTTSPGMIIGTPSYMAPEQANGAPGITLDGRADIYSLGIVLYEMLTGALPFEADTPMGMLLHHLNTKPRPLTEMLPGLSAYPGLCTTVMKCLSKIPQQRFANASELVTALTQAEAELGRNAATVIFSRMATAVAPNAEALAEQTSVPKTETVEPRPLTNQKLEIAHVLFLDVVGYSRLPMTEQAEVIQDLQRIVASTPEFMAGNKEDLIVLPTGDGMALSFFGNPEAPLRCAITIARTVKQNPQLQLRMGLHSGPVYRVRDIKDNVNVAGGGINYAQRVMDCGDAGHILASGTIADLLTQHSTWTSHLHGLGIAEVKHGVKLRVFNVHTSDAGNPTIPERLRSNLSRTSPEYVTPPISTAVSATPAPKVESRTSASDSSQAVTPAIVEQAAKELAHYIGPIARVVAKRKSQNCSTVKEFYLTLAQEITVPKDREAFLNSRRRNP